MLGYDHLTIYENMRPKSFAPRINYRKYARSVIVLSFHPKV
jgi:hypothetical protein